MRIWVDSEASRDGGRALWGIPKELASFELSSDDRTAHVRAADDRGEIATARLRRWAALPGRLPVGFSVVQWLDGRAKVSRVRARAGVEITATGLDVAERGPLGFLRGRRPLIGFTLRDFVMRFGA